MKTISANKQSGKSDHQSDDEKIRYKLNKDYFNNVKSPVKPKLAAKYGYDDDNIRYKLPPSILSKPKLESKHKPKTKIKVNFWSNKQTGSRLHSTQKMSTHRHSVAETEASSETKSKRPTVKVLKRVSFLPTPLFSDNHTPMLTVPDDLSIKLNEEEAKDLHEDLNQAIVNSNNSVNSSSKKMKSADFQPQSSPNKHKRCFEGSDVRGDGNANELEFFSKYVVQKLRKMETNQRIYSENLINTVLMLGQLGKLNGKSKIGDT